jgi:Uncharacterized protein conserved in bacteria
MRLSSLLIILALLFPLTACKRKDNEDQKQTKAEALYLASEARVNFTLRDYKEAEKGYLRATELDPEEAEYWFHLGYTRLKLNDKSGAIAAYKRELAIREKAAEKAPDDLNAVLEPAAVMVRLGRTDDARKLVEKIMKQFANNPAVIQMRGQNLVDSMLQNPSVKDASVQSVGVR